MAGTEKTLHYLQWHITHTCNLRCAHCYQDNYQETMEEEELFRVLDDYVTFLKKKNLRGQINLTGGEPLLHPAFFALAEKIKEEGLRLGILTNGTLIDEEMAVKLAALKPVFVQVSLDGSEQYHDQIRGKGNYQKTFQGVDLLKRHGVKVLVSFTAQKSNYRTFLALARACAAHRVDKLWWDRVVTQTPEEKDTLALTTGQFRFLVRMTNILALYYRKTGKLLISNSRALQNPWGVQGCDYLCSAGKNLLIILANGDLMPCRRLPFVIGNVKDAPIEETVQNSTLMKELAIPRYPKGCVKCKKFDSCRGGARCVTYGQTRDLHRKDVNCSRVF